MRESGDSAAYQGALVPNVVHGLLVLVARGVLPLYISSDQYTVSPGVSGHLPYQDGLLPVLARESLALFARAIRLLYIYLACYKFLPGYSGR